MGEGAVYSGQAAGRALGKDAEGTESGEWVADDTVDMDEFEEGVDVLYRQPVNPQAAPAHSAKT